MLPPQVQQKYVDKFGSRFRKWLIGHSKNELKRMKFELTLYMHLRGMSRSAIMSIGNMDPSLMKIRLFDAMKMNELSRLEVECK